MNAYLYWAFLRNKVRIAAARLGIGTHYDEPENTAPDYDMVSIEERREFYRDLKEGR